jgi:hypothetical protein
MNRDSTSDPALVRTVSGRRSLRLVSPSDEAHGERGADASGSPVEGLSRYQGPPEPEEDFRHRMLLNGAALLFSAGLGGAGIWLAISMADHRRNQDCVMAGRRNCAQISIPSGPGLLADQQAAPGATR